MFCSGCCDICYYTFICGSFQYSNGPCSAQKHHILTTSYYQSQGAKSNATSHYLICMLGESQPSARHLHQTHPEPQWPRRLLRNRILLSPQSKTDDSRQWVGKNKLNHPGLIRLEQNRTTIVIPRLVNPQKNTTPLF